jgi:hypothetical protein
MSCTHTAFSQDGFVCLSNDDDDHYEQQFSTRDEIEKFIEHLKYVANNTWPEGTDEKELQEHYAELNRLKREEYRKNNPPAPRLSKEQIEEHNKKLSETGLPSVALNYITPLEVLETLASDTSSMIRG